MADYNKVGLVVVREGRVLLCRKRNSTSLLILPGGCLEQGETALACLERELREELGEVRAVNLRYVGAYTDRAAGAPGKTVAIELYRGELEGTPEPHSEIAELVWFGEDDDRALLAPSLVNKIFPDLVRRGLLPWGVAGGVELLAPARDLDCGLAAIDCGADAVYIGAPKFGAREAAGNAVGEIAELAAYAHKYWARVYVTLNTLLRDDELAGARRLAWQLYEAGIDGLIIQDAGLLEGDLPPLPLIASTQMHNHTPERVAFLEAVGFRRAILARELGLDQIRAIRRAAPRIELEFFVHGALCVCYSGQCYLSYALGGRSGNRGQCAQPCRKPYTLVDSEGRAIAQKSHLLSVRDLNLSDHLPELLAAGITSFKIEGRLKDRTYVANVVAHYRAKLDEALAAAPPPAQLDPAPAATPLPAQLDPALPAAPVPARLDPAPAAAPLAAQLNPAPDATLPPARLDPALPAAPPPVGAGHARPARGQATPRRSSSGISSPGFTPDPSKTFNRGFTTYFLRRKRAIVGSPETPKMVGEEIGKVTSASRDEFTIETATQLHAGDGLCFFDSDGELRGTVVNAVRGNAVVPDKIEGIEPGIVIHRNHDHEFLTRIARSRPVRRVSVRMTLAAAPGGVVLRAEDEDANRAEAVLTCALEPAAKPDRARDIIRRQLEKTGETHFVSAGVSFEIEPAPFLPVSAVNALRREVLERLSAVRESNRPRFEGGVVRNDVPFPAEELSYLGNVLNRDAEAFYRRHGVQRIEPAAESGLDLTGRKVMTTRHCVKLQLGLCGRTVPEPLALIDEQGRRLELEFDCEACEMSVFPARPV